MIALFVALSGTGYAAVQVARNSISSIHVKDRSLLAKDFRRGQLPRGPAGPIGPAGAAKAFARVLAGGDVDDPRARGINDAAVSKPATGVYCIDVEGGALNAVASIDAAGGSGPGEIRASTLLASCPSGKEVEVQTFDSAGIAADRAFFLFVN